MLKRHCKKELKFIFITRPPYAPYNYIQKPSRLYKNKKNLGQKIIFNYSLILQRHFIVKRLKFNLNCIRYFFAIVIPAKAGIQFVFK